MYSKDHVSYLLIKNNLNNTLKCDKYIYIVYSTVQWVHKVFFNAS